MADEIDPKRQLLAAGNVITMLDKKLAELEVEIERLQAQLNMAWGLSSKQADEIKQLHVLGDALAYIINLYLHPSNYYVRSTVDHILANWQEARHG